MFCCQSSSKYCFKTEFDYAAHTNLKQIAFSLQACKCYSYWNGLPKLYDSFIKILKMPFYC